MSAKIDGVHQLGKSAVPDITHAERTTTKKRELKSSLFWCEERDSFYESAYAITNPRVLIHSSQNATRATLRLLLFCGERGIRTPGTSQYVGFQDRCNRPLCHLSNTAPRLRSNNLCRLYALRDSNPGPID